MFCDKCGEKLPEGSRFCTNCGAILQAEETRERTRSSDRGKKTLIVLVLILVLLAAALSGIALGKVLAKKDGGTSAYPGGASTYPGGDPAYSDGGVQPVSPQQPDTPAWPDDPAQPGAPLQPEPTAKTSDALRFDHMEHMQNGEFKLEYPVFAGRRSEELNRLVKDYALGLGMGGSILNNSYEADYLCEVTLVNDYIVSMVFCGTGYVPEAAHDFREVLPLNVEIGPMRSIVLWDIFAMDMDGFADIVYGSGRPYGASWSVPAADFPDLLDLDREIYQGLMRAPNGFLTTGGPVLLSYVGITGVEWLDVLVPIDLIRDYYNNDAIPWEMLYTNN